MVFDIDWQGYRQMRAALPEDVVGLFVLPPTVAELERRLRGRGTDSEAVIAGRMAAARGEMSHAAEFDFVLVNDDLEQAVDAARSVLVAARLAVRRQAGLLARFT